jgi:hypothetical protein
MIDRFTRRRLLALVPIVASSFAGCVPESGSQASLGIESLNVSESNGIYTIEMTPEVGVVGDWEPFRNVSVIVQNESGTVVCRKPIDDLTKSGEYDLVTFTCGEFPHTITYEFDRDPCQGNTTVHKRVYVEETDRWTEEFVECAE